MHPYEMQQLIRERCTDYVIKVRAGSLYHTIERLHRGKLIEQVETGRDGRRPERTVYACTEAGRDEYFVNLRELVRLPEDEYPLFGAALEMLDTLDPAEAQRLLSARTTTLEARLAAGEQVVASLSKRGLPRIAIIENEYALAMYRAELAWVRDLIDDIKSGQLPWDMQLKTEETLP
jgi:DNA-binding PadR family transcriptional regulator